MYPHFEAGFQFRHIAGVVSQGGEVLGPLVLAYSALILSEGNVQAPVQGVIDTPVGPYRGQNLFRRDIQAADEMAWLHCSPRLCFPSPHHLHYRAQPRPLLSGAQIVQAFGIAGGPGKWLLTVVKRKPKGNRFEVPALASELVEADPELADQVSPPEQRPGGAHHKQRGRGLNRHRPPVAQTAPICLNPFVTHPVRPDSGCCWPVRGSKGAPETGRCHSRPVLEVFCVGFTTMA